MPRAPKVWWHKGNGAWCSEVGEKLPSGKRAPVYFWHPNTTRGERAAQAELSSFLEERTKKEKEGFTLALNPPVSEVVQFFLQDCERRIKINELKCATYDGYQRMLAIWTGRHGDREARTIEPNDLHVIVKEWREERGHGAWYVGRLIRTVKTCWAWAARPEEGRPPLIPFDPLSKIKTPKVPKKRTRYATRGEVARLIREIWRWSNQWKPQSRGTKCGGCLLTSEERAQQPGGKCQRSHSATAALRRAMTLMVRIAYHAGCRPGELCAATWEDWSFPAWTDPGGHAWGVIVLGDHKTAGSTGKFRTVLVPPRLALALERWRESSVKVEGGAIFGHRRGRGYGNAGPDAPQGIAYNTTGLDKVVREARERAGIPDSVTLYTLRHTYLSDARMGGIPDAVAGSVAGTSARMIESTYGHILDEAIAKAASEIASKRRR